MGSMDIDYDDAQSDRRPHVTALFFLFSFDFLTRMRRKGRVMMQDLWRPSILFLYQ